MTDLINRLRIKAGMMELGELVAWGSDTALMREAADALERLAAPAVQGEPAPEGCALIKLDSRTGMPLVTSEMKAKHIGEYWWDEEAPYYDENGDLHDYVARHAVPWSLCKDIYKSMAKSAMLSTQPAEHHIADEIPARTTFGGQQRFTVAEQQPAPDVEALVEALELALEYWRHRQQRYRNRRPKWVIAAESALAARRKQQEGQP